MIVTCVTHDSEHLATISQGQNLRLEVCQSHSYSEFRVGSISPTREDQIH